MPFLTKDLEGRKIIFYNFAGLAERYKDMFTMTESGSKNEENLTPLERQLRISSAVILFLVNDISQLIKDFYNPTIGHSIFECCKEKFSVPPGGSILGIEEFVHLGNAIQEMLKNTVKEKKPELPSEAELKAFIENTLVTFKSPQKIAFEQDKQMVFEYTKKMSAAKEEYQAAESIRDEKLLAWELAKVHEDENSPETKAEVEKAQAAYEEAEKILQEKNAVFEELKKSGVAKAASAYKSLSNLAGSSVSLFSPPKSEEDTIDYLEFDFQEFAEQQKKELIEEYDKRHPASMEDFDQVFGKYALLASKLSSSIQEKIEALIVQCSRADIGEDFLADCEDEAAGEPAPGLITSDWVKLGGLLQEFFKNVQGETEPRHLKAIKEFVLAFMRPIFAEEIKGRSEKVKAIAEKVFEWRRIAGKLDSYKERLKEIRSELNSFYGSFMKGGSLPKADDVVLFSSKEAKKSRYKRKIKELTPQLTEARKVVETAIMEMQGLSPSTHGSSGVEERTAPAASFSAGGGGGGSAY